MPKYLFLSCVLLLCCRVPAAELRFDFSEMKADEQPPGFRSAVAGEGKPGDWRIILDEVPSAFAPYDSNAPVVTKRAVLAQLSRDPTDEHFPLLIHEGDTFTDFTFITRFKTVSGAAEQMAGVVFRLQDERNFYVLRASSLGNTFRFYKMVAGERSPPIGPEVEIPRGQWHELSVECKGNQIRCLLNGKEAIPPLTDTSFNSGKVGFWTKSDSVSYFSDAVVTYVPREIPALTMVRDTMKKYPRLLGLKVYAPFGNPRQVQIIGSSDESEMGKLGGDAEQSVLKDGDIYYNKSQDSVTVIMPLRDRNGDSVAAVRVVMRTFTGQTQQNAIVRAKPVVKELQRHVKVASDLVE